MFSPISRPFREGIMKTVFEPNALQDAPPSPTPSELELELSDPAALSDDDQTAFYELQDIEEQFEMYTSVKIDYLRLTFDFESHNVSPHDPPSIVSILPPALPETRHLNYKLRGLESLLPVLEGLVCSHPGLVSQRNDLVAVTRFEMNNILQELWDQHLRLQSSTTPSELDARRVLIGNRSINAYTNPLVTSAIILTSIGHAIMGVTRTHCNFILASMKAIISMTARMLGDDAFNSTAHVVDAIPATLPTALHRLNLSPAFVYYACCPTCSTLYPLSTSSGSELPTQCTAKNPDGIECSGILSISHRRGNQTWQKPVKRYSHMQFEAWISELLQRPGIEDLLESGCQSSSPDAMGDVWDGPYLQEFPNPAGPMFKDFPPSELRLAMLLHHDFFNPFQNKTAGKLRSIGCFFMICLNLPTEVRYDAANAYLVSVIPGPSETKLDDLHHFVQPIVNDMIEMFSPGIWVSKTYKYPQGRKVRAAITIESMDTPAARGNGGFASHSHTCFCHLCTVTLAQIDHTSLSAFQLRTISLHRQQVMLWTQAQSVAQRKKVYDQYGVRYSPWLQLPYWNPFSSTVIGPMHWTKNILDKHLRKNMAWSWSISAGIPQDTYCPLQPVLETEYEWGIRALYCLNERDFLDSRLTSPLVHYLCRERHIFETGLSSQRLLSDLNQWRKEHGIISLDGSITENIIQQYGNGLPVSTARARYYISKPKSSPALVSAHATVTDLIHLCELLGLPAEGRKDNLSARLLEYYANVCTPIMADIDSQTEPPKSKKAVSLLGIEILSEVKADMCRTILPSWLKRPPMEFATVNHGKLQSEEYKSLALVSFTITLVRLWGFKTGLLQEVLDNFLHLMLAVRILAFQSLTELEIVAFDLNFQAYMGALKRLYPASSFIPVQHMGLHIPQFLRSMGPSTRYSESTCELFIGMFQNIATNFKFGDLEVTLHREFVMASRLKGLIADELITQQLAEFGTVVQDYLEKHVPNQTNQLHGPWKTTHGNTPTTVPDEVTKTLASWAEACGTRAFPDSLFVCSSIRHGNLIYTPYESSLGDACIYFTPSPDSDTFLPGRIELILEEPMSMTQDPRILLIVRAFRSLSSQDSKFDPYVNHSIIGRTGANLAQLYYDEPEASTHLIEPRCIISHVAICAYQDPLNSLSRKCNVILSLDLKHKRFA